MRRAVAQVRARRDARRQRDKREREAAARWHSRPRPFKPDWQLIGVFGLIVGMVGLGTLEANLREHVAAVLCLASALGLPVLVLLGARGATRLRDRRLRRRWGAPERLPLPDGRPGAIHVDPGWPGRTRLRVPAPAPLPMVGPARLVPLGSGRSRRERTLGWTGRGADDARRWDAELRPHLASILAGVGRGAMQASLSPQGLIVHLPLVLPDAEGVEVLRRAGAGLSDVIAELARSDTVEGIRLGDPTEAAGDCACCWEPIGDAVEAVRCPECDARQHLDCAEFTGGCARFACASAPQ